MKRILMMEGNPKARRERAVSLGIASASSLYQEAISAHFPDLAIDVVNAADPGAWFPEDRMFGDYAGLVVCGSSLHAYDSDFAVTNQVAMLRAACETGLPVLGSCWGLQIAAIAAGATVRLCPKGREVGIARKITRTVAGIDHPFLADKPGSFDAPCIHYDEVADLPANCTVLAYNAHSAVQAAILPIGRSEVWAVQYHPEFDLARISDLYRLYAADMVSQGFFNDDAAMASYQEKIEQLAAHPEDMGLGWQLGIDSDILDDRIRRGEIIAWIRHRIL